MQSKKKSETILFLHLAKTAGTTLNQALGREYSDILSLYIPKESKDLFEDFKNRLKTQTAALIRGHFEFGWHHFLTRPFTYFTIMREPIERVISEYHYILSKPGHPMHEQVGKHGAGLPKFVKDLHTPNLQTKKISGISFAANSGITGGENIDGHNMLEIAKENLAGHFAVVGLTERFDETLILLKREFGWAWPYYIRDNITPKKTARRDIPASTIKIIEENNLLDIELYEYAVKLFEKKVRSQGKTFAAEVEMFRKLNKINQEKILRRKGKPVRFLKLKRKIKKLGRILSMGA
jgi:hypothetical protein